MYLYLNNIIILMKNIHSCSCIVYKNLKIKIIWLVQAIAKFKKILVLLHLKVLKKLLLND